MSATYTILDTPDAAARKLRPGMTIAELDKIARKVSPPMPRASVRRAPDAAKARPFDKIAAELDRAIRTNDPRARAAAGAWLSDTLQIAATDGSAAVLAIGARPADTPVRYGGLDTSGAPDLLWLTPAFWDAYARVRTCRPQSGAMTITVYCGDVTIATGDLDCESGAIARETVPGAGCADAAHCPEPVSVTIADRYLWPIRGIAAAVKHYGDADNRRPAYIPLTDERALLIMPMKDQVL